MRHSLSLAALPCWACLAFPAALAQPVATELEEESYPTVITPARLRQSLADVPASVTVITGETLRQYGIRNVPDALRLVPGMAVTHATGPDYRINYHGTNMLSPRRMNVLVDGISVYRPAFSEVIWSQLPLVVEDIDRLEVTRGPNSAAYGPNSMLAVVNIITRHPRDVDRAFGAITAGSRSETELTARGAFNLGASSVSVTAHRRRDSGFDRLTQDPAGHDGFSRSMVSLRSETPLSAQRSLGLRASVVDGVAQVPYADDYQVSYPDRRFRDWYLGGTLTTQLSPHHDFVVRFDHASQRDRQDWRTCAPTVTLLPELFSLWRANPSYVDALLRGALPSGGSSRDDALAAAAVVAIRALGPRAMAPTCVTANQDTRQWRSDLELQSTYVVSERLRFVAGGGLRHQGGQSETYLGGRLSSRLRWLFGNLEWRPINALTANLGGYYEYNSQSPASFSPRGALNFRLDPAQTVRFVVSKGTRSPDIQEQRTNWSYTFADADPPLANSGITRFYQSRTGPGDLVSERLTSAEVGYLLNLQPAGLLLDVRVFRERLTRLISERTNLAGAEPTNTGAVTLRGAEMQAQWAVTPDASVFLNYAYLDNLGATNALERSQYSRHSGSIGGTRDFGGGWRASLAYFGASGDGLSESRYGRLDLTVTKSGRAGSGAWSTTIGLRRLDDTSASYANGDASLLANQLNDRLQTFVQFTMRLP